MRINFAALLLSSAGLIGFIILIGPLLAPYDPTNINMEDRLAPISKEHLLGADHLGRDLLSRILIGAQSTVGTSFLVLFIALLIGVPIGLLSGYLGGWVDRVLMKLVDGFMAFPDYIAAIVISGLLGPGIINLVIAIVFVKWVGYARLARSIVLSEKQKDYMLMAKINGLGPLQIIRRHMLPHIAGNILVLATLDVGKIILMIASFSYIGLGAQPPAPEWGAMLNDGKAYFYQAPQLMIIPGIAIIFVVLICHLLGDYLRDRMDVKKV